MEQSISTLLKNYRSRYGMTQEEFAKNILHIHPARLRRIEQGHSRIYLDEILNMVNALRVPLEVILEGVLFEKGYLDYLDELKHALYQNPINKEKLNILIENVNEKYYDGLTIGEKERVDLFIALSEYSVGKRGHLDYIIKKTVRKFDRKRILTDQDLFILTVEARLSYSYYYLREIYNLVNKEYCRQRFTQQQCVWIMLEVFEKMIYSKPYINPEIASELLEKILEIEMYSELPRYYKLLIFHRIKGQKDTTELEEIYENLLKAMSKDFRKGLHEISLFRKGKRIH